jgi:hypothetical protein
MGVSAEENYKVALEKALAVDCIPTLFLIAAITSAYKTWFKLSSQNRLALKAIPSANDWMQCYYDAMLLNTLEPPAPRTIAEAFARASIFGAGIPRRHFFPLKAIIRIL